jgi:hypothetical protein
MERPVSGSGSESLQIMMDLDLGGPDPELTFRTEKSVVYNGLECRRAAKGGHCENIGEQFSLFP